MSALLDSNILVALIAKDHSRHEACWMAFESSDAFLLCDHSLFEAYKWLTFQNVERNGFGLGAEAAAEAIRSISNHCVIVSLSPAQRLEALSHFAGQGVISARIYDAMIGHTGIVNGATKIITLNSRHFRSLFPNMEIIEPL
jgi:predicted nucleic acid-binding protein